MNVVQKGCTFIMYFEPHVQLLSRWTSHVKENYIYTKEKRTLMGFTRSLGGRNSTDQQLPRNEAVINNIGRPRRKLEANSIIT